MLAIEQMQTDINILDQFHKQKKKNMDEQELEKKIHDYIRNLYKAEYKGRLGVSLNNGVYSLCLGIPSYDRPTYISLQTDSEQEFLDYICDELKNRNYLRIYFYSIKRTDKHLPKAKVNGKI